MANKKYCYLLPDFPKKAFILIPFFLVKENIDIFPIHKVCETVEDLCEYMNNFAEEIKTRHKDLKVLEVCAILPIKFKSLYPLRREYWENSSIEYGYDERKHLFVALLANPSIHDFLVTPSRYMKKENYWELSAALPIKMGTSEDVIEQFMLSSDMSVNAKASHAAIYSVGKGQTLNWITKKIERTNIPPLAAKSNN